MGLLRCRIPRCHSKFGNCFFGAICRAGPITMLLSPTGWHSTGGEWAFFFAFTLSLFKYCGMFPYFNMTLTLIVVVEVSCALHYS